MKLFFIELNFAAGAVTFTAQICLSLPSIVAVKYIDRNQALAVAFRTRCKDSERVQNFCLKHLLFGSHDRNTLKRTPMLRSINAPTANAPCTDCDLKMKAPDSRQAHEPMKNKLAFT